MSASEMVVIIRPSFKKFCGQDACRAALFNHLLYWIAQKAKGQDRASVQEGAVYWYSTAEEIYAGLDNSWSINKVRKELKALVEAGLIGQCRNPTKGWDQTRHYFIGSEQGKVIRDACEKHGICLLHLGLRPDVLHLLSVVNAFDKNGKCSCQVCEMEPPHVVDATTKNGNAIPKDNPKVSFPKDTRKDDDKGEKDSSPSIDSSLVSWIEEKGILRSHDQMRVDGQLAELVGDIKTKEQFEKVYLLANEEVNRPGKDGKVRLGNLVSAKKVWLKTLVTDDESKADEVAYSGPSEADCEELKKAIYHYHSALIVVVLRSQFGLAVSIKRDDEEYRNIPVFSLDDWYNNVLKNDVGLLKQAVEYGASLAERRRVG